MSLVANNLLTKQHCASPMLEPDTEQSPAAFKRQLYKDDFLRFHADTVGNHQENKFTRFLLQCAKVALCDVKLHWQQTTASGSIM